MTYRELLKLYKNGTLEEEKRKKIEADIERQDAISEYLFDEGTVPGFEELSVPTDYPPTSPAESTSPSVPEETAFLKTIHQSIRRAFLKMGVIVGFVVLAVTLFVLFALPHVISLFYYNPEEVVGPVTEWRDTDRMSLDMAVYTELFVPGYYRDTVISTDRGYGEYDIRINQTASTNGLFTNISGVIKRNELILYDTNYLKLPSSNVFLRTEDTPGLPFSALHDEDDTVHPMGASGTPEYALEKLQALNEDNYYLAYVTLEHLTSYDDFISWFNEKKLRWGSVWCSVYAEGKYNNVLLSNVGFSPYLSGSDLYYEEEHYPYLRLNGPDAFNLNGEDMKTHFLSMLRYMQDNETFLEMITAAHGYGHPMSSAFDAIIQEIEENGLWLNGFAIVAKKESILKISEDERVCYIHTTPMR